MTSPLRVAFDGAELAAGPPTGVARAFLHALAAYASTAHCTVVIPPGPLHPEVEAALPTAADVLRSDAVVGFAGRVLRLPRLLRRLGVDVWHSPVTAIPLRAPCPVLATVHDLPWLADLPPGEPGVGRRHRLAFALAVRRAAAIVVPSTATADDLRRAAGGRLRTQPTVVPHGIPLPIEAAPLAGRDGPFLVIGDARPRKNLDRVRRAHDLARSRAPQLPALRLLGPGFDFVSETEKHVALRRATALVHVSLLEGFGLPVIEAFGHGTPVLCSTRGALAEVAGDAARVVDPEDPQDIARGMREIHGDAALRHRLAEQGRARAAQFTPDRTAAAWDALHRRLVAGRSTR